MKINLVTSTPTTLVVHMDHLGPIPNCIEKRGVFLCSARMRALYMVSGAPHAYQMHAQM